MGRHNKATKERKAKAKEETKPVETSNKDVTEKPSAPAMAAQVSTTNSTSVEAKSKAAKFFQASEGQRPQETARGNGTANGSCLINERGKESGCANEAMKTKAAQVSATNSTSVEAKSKAVEFVQASEDQRLQETVRGNGTANGSCLINERGKDSGCANEAMKTKEAPRCWTQLSSGDLPKFEEAFREQSSKLDGLQKPRVEGSNSAENSVYSGGDSKFGEAASSVGRLQPSNLEGLQKPRVEGSNPAENNGYGGGHSKSGEVSSVVTLRPSKLEDRQKPRVEGSNPVDNKGNGVGYSAQSHSGDFRTAGSGRGGGRGGYGHQSSRVEKSRVGGSNYRLGYSAQSHSRDFRTTGNGRGGIGGRGYGYQAWESQVDDFTRIDCLGRLLSSILRHEAAELGLNIRSDGHVLVKDLLNLRRRTHAGLPLSSHTVDDIKEVVRMDKKQRFGLREENDLLLIRANQGHSIQTIKSEDLLSPVYSFEEVPGMRSDCEGLIHLDVEKYLKDGMKLYPSENGGAEEGDDEPVDQAAFDAAMGVFASKQEAREAGILAERDRALHERDAALYQRDAITVERDTAVAQRDTVTAQRDALQTQVAGLQVQLDAAMAKGRHQTQLLGATTRIQVPHAKAGTQIEETVATEGQTNAATQTKTAIISQHAHQMAMDQWQREAARALAFHGQLVEAGIAAIEPVSGGRS